MINFRQGLAVAGASLLLFGFAAQAPAPVRVQVDSGTLIGAREGDTLVFRGIPFAKPPVGDLRWAPPQPIRWDGERQATSFALPCAQETPADGSLNAASVSGATSEDCLYLNIWAPANAQGAPVMMWLHGGGNYVGAAQNPGYIGDAFADDGVILVTVSYRLGALGSFAHPALTKAANGQPVSNYALMDALAGLEWIQRNIAAFGGDPSRVTLFGQSAGGGMVANLMSSPKATGLFSKVIIQSGAGRDQGITLAQGEARGAEIATALGLPGADATVEQLRALPAASFYNNPRLRLGTQQVIDGQIRTGVTTQRMTEGAAIYVPLMIGSTSGEDEIREAHDMADRMAPHAPVFEYYFSYTPTWRTGEWPSGPPHAGELPYTFDTLATSAKGGGDQVTDRDRAMAAQANSCWTAFAKAPITAQSITCEGGLVWSARNGGESTMMVFDENPVVQTAAALLDAKAKARAEAASRRVAAN